MKTNNNIIILLLAMPSSHFTPIFTTISLPSNTPGLSAVVILYATFTIRSSKNENEKKHFSVLYTIQSAISRVRVVNKVFDNVNVWE